MVDDDDILEMKAAIVVIARVRRDTYIGPEEPLRIATHESYPSHGPAAERLGHKARRGIDTGAVT